MIDAHHLIAAIALVVIAIIGLDLARELARPQPRRVRHRRR